MNEALELRGIEPRTSHMRSEHSTSELQPHVSSEVVGWAETVDP